jgi:aromatic ring-opening dioxygenase LigB subunit
MESIQRATFYALDIIQLLYHKSDINIKHQNNNKMKDGNNQSQVEQMNVVFIVGSMSKQSHFAFICELEYFDAIPINVINNNTPKHYIQNHKNYQDFIHYDDSVIYNLNNNHFEHKYHINLTTIRHNNNDTRRTLLLHTLYMEK